MIKGFILFLVSLIIYFTIAVILGSGKIKTGYTNFNEQISFEKNNAFIPDGLLTLDSTPVDLELFKGKTTLLQFSFNGCAPCKRAKQIFPYLLDDSPDNFQIITLSIDNYNLWSKVNFNKERWTKINIGKSDLKNSLKINAYPTYIVINEEGNIISRPNNGISYIRNLYQVKPSTNINLIKEFLGGLFHTNRFWNFILGHATIYSILFCLFLFVRFLIKTILKNRKGASR